VYQKSGLIREVVSVEGDKLFTISVYQKSGLIREVVSVEEDKLVYYLSVSEIWPDKRGGL
jgi:hypothetical protein